VQLGSADVPAAPRTAALWTAYLTASAGGIAAWKELLKSSYGMGINTPGRLHHRETPKRFKKLPRQDLPEPSIGSARDQGYGPTRTAELTKRARDGEFGKKFGAEGIHDATTRRRKKCPGRRRRMKPYWENLGPRGARP